MSRRPPEVPKALPCSLDAERSVLGSVLIDNAGFDLVSSRLQARHFFRDAHRRIWTVMGELRERSQPIDLVSMKEALEPKIAESGQTWLEECGGPAYVASLVDGVPRSTNIGYYADVVIGKANKRALIDIGNKLVNGAYADQETDRALMTDTDLALTGLASESGMTLGVVPIGETMSATMREYELREAHRGQLLGITSGFKNIDLFTHGWQRQTMNVIAAQTSFGKTLLALKMARAMAGAGERVIYYSFEMKSQSLKDRMVSDITGIELDRLIWWNVSVDDQVNIGAALELISALPLEINDGGRRTVSDIRAECRQVKSARGLGAVMIDHFQLLPDAAGETRYEQLAKASRRLKELAGELDVPVFVLSQLTLSDKDAHREPQLDDLRECKSLGHDADDVWFIHPYKPATAREEMIVPMKILRRKAREGRTGLMTMNLEKEYQRFVEADPPPPPVREPKATKASKNVEKLWTGE